MLFQSKIKYTKQLEDGSFKRVSEEYLFASESFTDCEARINEELGKQIRGEFNILAIKLVSYEDIFIDESDSDVSFYSCKVKHLNLDSEKNVKSKFLISAPSIEDAQKDLKEMLGPVLHNFELESIVETKIIEFFPYEDIRDEQANS